VHWLENKVFDIIDALCNHEDHLNFHNKTNKFIYIQYVLSHY